MRRSQSKLVSHCRKASAIFRWNLAGCEICPGNARMAYDSLHHCGTGVAVSGSPPFRNMAVPSGGTEC
jgi:hypothetical protein